MLERIIKLDEFLKSDDAQSIHCDDYSDLLFQRDVILKSLRFKLEDFIDNRPEHYVISNGHHMDSTTRVILVRHIMDNPERKGPKRWPAIQRIKMRSAPLYRNKSRWCAKPVDTPPTA